MGEQTEPASQGEMNLSGVDATIDPVDGQAGPDVIDGDRGDDNSLEARTERAALGVSIAQQICTLMGVQAESISGSVEDDDITVAIDGLSIDPEALDGRAFESMQFLLNKAIQRHGGRRNRLTLRVQGVRSRRRESLDKTAAILARRAAQLGRVITLGPLDPADLRGWSVALQRAGGADVTAVGTPEARRIVIAPEGVDTEAGARRGRRRRRRRRN